MARRELAGLDPDAHLTGATSLENHLNKPFIEMFAYSRILSTLAIIAIVLTATGLYGTAELIRRLRTREIGIRMALGATPRNILWEASRDAATMAVVALLLGTVMSIGLTRYLSAVLVGLAEFDRLILIVVAASILGLILCATLLPLLRMARMNPARILYTN